MKLTSLAKHSYKLSNQTEIYRIILTCLDVWWNINCKVKTLWLRKLLLSLNWMNHCHQSYISISFIKCLTVFKKSFFIWRWYLKVSCERFCITWFCIVAMMTPQQHAQLNVRQQQLFNQQQQIMNRANALAQSQPRPPLQVKLSYDLIKIYVILLPMRQLSSRDQMILS